MMTKFVRSSFFALILAAFLPLTSALANPEVNSTKISDASSVEKAVPMTKEQMVSHIREANDVAKEWKKFGHHPFGAVLVGPDNKRVVMSQGNLSVVRHAETELCRRAAEAFTPEYLKNCTLVTTMEPCVMCSGNIYFSNIGNVVYGATEKMLGKLTGTSSMNPTMNLPCEKVFEAGQKKIQVSGPFPELEAELIEPHKDFWK